MLWNKKDPPVSEAAVQAVGWQTVNTEDGLMVTWRGCVTDPYLDFWTVEWKATEYGPALVCGNILLGYTNYKGGYAPQSVTVESDKMRGLGHAGVEPRKYKVIRMIREMGQSPIKIPDVAGFKEPLTFYNPSYESALEALSPYILQCLEVVGEFGAVERIRGVLNRSQQPQQSPEAPMSKETPVPEP